MTTREEHTEASVEAGGLIPAESASASIFSTQFRKKKLPVAALIVSIFLLLLATYAPFLALGMPFVLTTPEGTQFPLFANLFNRYFFENLVDIFFNLLLVLLPVYLLVWFLALKFGGDRIRRKRGLVLLSLVTLHFLLFVCFWPQDTETFNNPLYASAQYQEYDDYVADIVAAKANGVQMRAYFPPVHFSYRSPRPNESLVAPSGEHWLGTDTEGRDVLSRLIYGTRISLTIGVIAVSIYVVIGVVLGAMAGYFGGWTDILISRFTEVMICIPTFILILVLVSALPKRSIFMIMGVIGVTSWTGVARLVRAEFLSKKKQDYAQAALALGVSRWRIIFRHILPNALGPVFVSATFGVPAAILTESALSFLGLGDVTAPSWGEILNQGRQMQKMWLILAPGISIFLTVGVLNLVGEGVRDALDPKLRR